MFAELSIRTTLRSGDLGRIVTLHGEIYDALPGFGLSFEAYVGRTVAEFILDNEARGRIWLVERGNALLGCAAVVLRENRVGQIRWLVVDPSSRGLGVGKELMRRGLAYCRDQGCNKAVLETTDGLAESRALYDKLGFKVTSESIEELWQGPRELIVMQLDLN